jgi:RNA polymerase sigma factor (sigma-70 family)
MHEGRQASAGIEKERSGYGSDTEISSGAGASPNPEDLVTRIRGGDELAWRDLSDQYEPLLRWLARQHGLSADDASDAVQLTWLRCLEHIDQLTRADRLGAWLATICRRECIRLATKRRREVAVSGPDLVHIVDDRPEDRDPCAEAARSDERDRLHRAIVALPERQKMVVVELLRREGQTYLELSDRLGVPVGSIGPTRQRAFSRLRHDCRLAGLAPETSDRHLEVRIA